jgi:hypothetical protein
VAPSAFIDSQDHRHRHQHVDENVHVFADGRAHLGEREGCLHSRSRFHELPLDHADQFETLLRRTGVRRDPEHPGLALGAGRPGEDLVRDVDGGERADVLDDADDAIGGWRAVERQQHRAAHAELRHLRRHRVAQDHGVAIAFGDPPARLDRKPNQIRLRRRSHDEQAAVCTVRIGAYHADLAWPRERRRAEAPRLCLSHAGDLPEALAELDRLRRLKHHFHVVAAGLVDAGGGIRIWCTGYPRLETHCATSDAWALTTAGSTGRPRSSIRSSRSAGDSPSSLEPRRVT